MSREEQVLLSHIQAAIHGISYHLLECLDYNSYENNITIKRAVEREFEIIGEALSRLNKINPEIDISGKRRIIDFRNLLIHAYDGIDDVQVWAVIQNNLPLLEIEIDQLLAI